MALDVVLTSQYKQDYKRLKKQGLDLTKLQEVIDILVAQKPLEPHHKDHALKGSYKGYRDCHIAPDWVLIYKIEGNELRLANTGSHSYLGW